MVDTEGRPDRPGAEGLLCDGSGEYSRSVIQKLYAWDSRWDRKEAGDRISDLRSLAVEKADRSMRITSWGNVTKMRDAGEILLDGSEDELKELRTWLFKENIRVTELRSELEEVRELLEKEKKQFREEMKIIGRRMELDRKRLQQENNFFEQKLKILQSGFEKLEEDRRRFQREKDHFLSCREGHGESQVFFHRPEITTMLFRGVNSFLALKKRYKDLMKMYHPDNVAGDQEMVQLINLEYEELKKGYERH